MDEIMIGDEFLVTGDNDFDELSYIRVNSVSIGGLSPIIYYNGYTVEGTLIPESAYWNREPEDFEAHILSGFYVRKDRPNPNQKHVKQRLKR